jgi:hypothetical protein
MAFLVRFLCKLEDDVLNLRITISEFERVYHRVFGNFKAKWTLHNDIKSILKTNLRKLDRPHVEE